MIYVKNVIDPTQTHDWARMKDRDSSFAAGMAGEISDGLWLGTMQIRRVNMEDTRKDFLQRLPVGMRLRVVTTTEIKPISQSPADLNKWPSETGQVQ